jgi:post-segregation antitoxin (ccd killing protein)
MKKDNEKQRGGKREGAGRKPMGKRRYNVTLTEETAERAKEAEPNFSGLLDTLLSKWVRKTLD